LLVDPLIRLSDRRRRDGFALEEAGGGGILAVREIFSRQSHHISMCHADNMAAFWQKGQLCGKNVIGTGRSALEPRQ
jgi:hypothetical protein